MGVSIWEGRKAERVATALERIAVAHAKDIDIDSMATIQQIVRSGQAKEYFSIGDQIITPWAQDDTHTYDLPWDIVDFGPVTDPDGNVHQNAMWLQSHYALAAVQFDGNEAFYVPTEEMPAGTYHFTMGNAWGSNVVNGKSYQFTTTKAVPAGGQLVLGTATSNTSGLPDTAPANWRVRTFASGAQLTPDEILTLTEGTDGTDLGTLSSSTKYSESGINNMQRSAYGYNRWSQSAMRQWLNSADDPETWWLQQNPFDHRPDQLATLRGFKKGLPSDFLSIVKPVLVTTALNTVSDSTIGTTEQTADTFFCTSLQQEYIAPQLNNTEGIAFEYWKQRLGLTSPQKTGTDGANTAHIRYAIENHTSAQTVRLRSAYRSTANYVWFVYSSGYASSYGTATHANRPAPACAIY